MYWYISIAPFHAIHLPNPASRTSLPGITRGPCCLSSWTCNKIWSISIWKHSRQHTCILALSVINCWMGAFSSLINRPPYPWMILCHLKAIDLCSCLQQKSHLNNHWGYESFNNHRFERRERKSSKMTKSS